MPNARIGLNPAETTMADMLKARGYHTAIFGKWHIGDAPQFMPNQQGFDEYFGIPYSGDMWPKNIRRGIGHFKPLYLYENERVVDTLNDQSLLTRQITEHSVRFIEKHRKEPFFLYVPHPQPHVPLHASGDFRGKSGNGMYSDVMAELDWSVGEILNALKTNGVDDNTLVVLTSDNGPWLAYGHQGGSARPLRNGKGTVWEGGVREPCIVRFPGKIPAGSVIATPLMTIDLLPTIAALTGAQLPALPIDGKNALPILTGESVAPLHEALFFYYNVNELQAARFGDWKLYFPHRYLRVDEPGHDGEPGTISMIKMETPELYHLRRDPSETTNVAADNPEIVAQIQALADTMRDRLGDALVKKTGKENREPGRIK
jgi:arylsulfatase